MSTVTPQQALTQIQQLATQSAQLAADGLAYQPPTPPLDVFSYWVPKTGKFVKPAFVRLLPDGRKAAYFAKNPVQWPMDIQLADEQGVYFRLTDTGDPTGWPPAGASGNFRMYPQANAGAPSLGFKISPRYYDPSQGRIQVATVTDVPTEWYTNSVLTKTTHLGPAQSFISLRSVAFSGFLGTQNALVCEYYYWQVPKGWNRREQFYLTADSGWTWWDVASLQADGSYLITNTSYPTKFIPDTTQLPVLPGSIVL